MDGGGLVDGVTGAETPDSRGGVSSSPASYHTVDPALQQPGAGTVQAISAALAFAEDAVHLDEEGRVEEATAFYQQCVDALRKVRGAFSVCSEPALLPPPSLPCLATAQRLWCKWWCQLITGAGHARSRSQRVQRTSVQSVA